MYTQKPLRSFRVLAPLTTRFMLMTINGTIRLCLLIKALGLILHVIEWPVNARSGYVFASSDQKPVKNSVDLERFFSTVLDS